MANPVEQDATQTLGTEATLAELRHKAVENLLLEGVRSAYTSTAKHIDHGLMVQTTSNGKPIDNFTVTGNVKESYGITAAGVNGDFQFNRLHGRSDSWRVESSVSHWDALMNDSDRGTLKLVGKQDGHDTSYLPAKSTVVEGKFDKNNQPIRLAELSDGPNGKPENEWNPNNHRKTFEFILDDAKLGKLSYNETRERFGNNSVEYRSVVRDMKGNVLGIVVQDMSPTKDGFTVSTSARRPDNFEGKK